MIEQFYVTHTWNTNGYYYLSRSELTWESWQLKGSAHSIKHQSFIYTRLNDETVLFQTIQFSISHLFAHSVNVKQF